MRVAYLGPAGTFSEDALRAAAGERRDRAAAGADDLRRDHRRRRGRAERALVPFENSIEGSVRATLDALAFDAPSVAIVGEHDQPITNSLIARARARARARSRSCSPTRRRAPSARASSARELPGRRGAGGAEHRRGGARGRRPRRALGGARRRRGGRGSTAASSCARGSRTTPTTSPGSSGSRPAGREPRGDGAVEDDADLLRARRGPPGRAGRGADRVLEPRGQPDPDRVAAAAPGPRAATCSSSTSRAPTPTRAVGEAIEALREQGRERCGCSAATRSTPRGIPGA